MTSTLIESAKAQLEHPKELPERVKHYISASLSENTIKTYISCLKEYLNWGGIIPSTPVMIASYLSMLADNGYAVATIDTHKTAISQAHVLQEHFNQTESELVKKVIVGIKHDRSTRQKKAAALKLDDLYTIVNMLDNLIVAGNIAALRDKALILISFAGGLRRSEVSALIVNDTLRFNNKGIIIDLEKSKGNQEGKEEPITIPYAKNNTCACPVNALINWLTNSGIKAGPIFRRIWPNGNIDADMTYLIDSDSNRKKYKSGLTGKSINEIIKRRIKEAGVEDFVNYSSHSMRAGIATNSLLENIPIAVVSKHLRHKNTKTTLSYFRLEESFENNPASII